MNNFNINTLLDEDFLTPAQERSIRRSVNYNLTKGKNPIYEIMISVDVWGSYKERIYYLSLDELKNQEQPLLFIYKEIMFMKIRFEVERYEEKINMHELAKILNLTPYYNHDKTIDYEITPDIMDKSAQILFMGFDFVMKGRRERKAIVDLLSKKIL